MGRDKRFKHLKDDPLYKEYRAKDSEKLEVDERFQQMFTDKRFTSERSKDKRGRNIDKDQSNDLKKFYSIENDEKQDVKSDDKTSESELSSSSDESDSDEEDRAEDLDVSKMKFDWKPLDHDAESTETITRRLAIQNLDWDHINVKDIYTLINSVRTPISVKIYISAFGKARLAKEEVQGPQELVDMPKVDEEEEEYRDLKEKIKALKNPKSKSYKVNEYEDADEVMDMRNEELRERIRTYQLNRMKYYYAIAEFDSPEAAEQVYKELDGMDYEGSSLELDLRFVPDDIEFDSSEVNAECLKAPDPTSYKAPLFINSALQQTTVKFTWDENDVKREEKLRKAYTKEELDKDDLDAYLAYDSDEDEQEEYFYADGDENQDDRVSVVTANSQARINKYRELLAKLDEEEEKKKKVDVDVEWTDYDGAAQSNSDDDSQSNSDDDQVELVKKKKESKRERKKKQEDSDDDQVELVKKKKKGKKERKKKQEDSDDDQVELVKKKKKGKKERKRKQEDDDDEKLDPELALFGLNTDRGEKSDFKFDPEDKRFEAVYESGLYNIDPSHPNFKRTSALEIIAERKRERRSKKLRSD